MPKFEVEAISAVHRTYLIEAETPEDAVDAVSEGDCEPIESAVMFTQIEEVKEVKYVN